MLRGLKICVAQAIGRGEAHDGYLGAAIGVDVAVATRRAEVAAGVRYEHQFGWGKQNDQDVISGIARGRVDVAQGLSLEGGALATRTRADGGGSDSSLFVGNRNNVANTYSFYAGPTFARRIGGLDVGAG